VVALPFPFALLDSGWLSVSGFGFGFGCGGGGELRSAPSFWVVMTAGASWPLSWSSFNGNQPGLGVIFVVPAPDPDCLFFSATAAACIFLDREASAIYVSVSEEPDNHISRGNTVPITPSSLFLFFSSFLLIPQACFTQIREG
jgi:hypothetical protein